MRIKFIVTISLVVILAFAINAFGGSRVRKETLTFSAPAYEVEDLIAEMQNDGGNVLVSGKIRNLCHNSVKGYVIIYFKNDKDKVVRSAEANVNDNMFFRHGKTGDFETTVNVGNVPDIQNVVVEFITK